MPTISWEAIGPASGLALDVGYRLHLFEIYNLTCESSFVLAQSICELKVNCMRKLGGYMTIIMPPNVKYLRPIPTRVIYPDSQLQKSVIPVD